MERNQRGTDPFAVNLSAAVVVRGDAMAVRNLIERLEEDAGRSRIVVVFVKVSPGKLWVKEGEP